MLLASISSPDVNAIHLGPLRFTFYGLLIAIGVAIGWRMTVRRYTAFGGNTEMVEKVLMRMVIFGFVGARVAYVSTHLDRFRGEWWKVIAIWEGGIALFGGLSAGAITVFVLLRRWGGNRSWFLDAIAPALPISQAIGRWGNYFNQELFGTPTTLPWGLEIAPRFRPDQYADSATFHPTFLYESLWNFALALTILRAERRNPRLKGRLIGLYFVGYGMMRFGLELIRTDTTFRFLGISRNGWVAGAVFVLGLTVVLRRRAVGHDDVEVIANRPG